VLFLDAANDFWGRLDFAMRTLENTGSSQLRMAYTPQYVHYIGPREALDLPMWMDWHLKNQGGPWPQTPVLAIEPGIDANARLRLTPDQADAVADVAIYYGLDTPRCPQRYYRLAPATRQGDDWVAPAPTSSPTDTIFAYANVTYRSSVTLSSRLARREARMLPGVRPTLRPTALIDAMENDEAWFVRYAETDPWHTVIYFAPRAVAGRTGLGPLVEIPVADPQQPHAFHFATLKLNDPQWHGTGTAPLLIDAAADAQFTLRLEARTHYTQGNEMQYEGMMEPVAGTDKSTGMPRAGSPTRSSPARSRAKTASRWQGGMKSVI
jgi:hypothetical protein